MLFLLLLCKALSNSGNMFLYNNIISYIQHIEKLNNCQIRHFAAGNITTLIIIKPMPYTKLQYGTEIYIKYVNQRHDVCTLKYLQSKCDI